jgi:hypothetical protein
MGRAVAVGGHGRWGVGAAHTVAVASHILQGGSLRWGWMGWTWDAPVGSPAPGSSLCFPAPISFAFCHPRSSSSMRRPPSSRPTSLIEGEGHAAVRKGGEIEINEDVSLISISISALIEPHWAALSSREWPRTRATRDWGYGLRLGEEARPQPVPGKPTAQTRTGLKTRVNH